MCVNGWESEDPFSVNSYESEYPKNDESGNIYESGKFSSSVNLVSENLLENYQNAQFSIEEATERLFSFNQADKYEEVILVCISKYNLVFRQSEKQTTVHTQRKPSLLTQSHVIPEW